MTSMEIAFLILSLAMLAGWVFFVLFFIYSNIKDYREGR